MPSSPALLQLADRRRRRQLDRVVDRQLGALETVPTHEDAPRAPADRDLVTLDETGYSDTRLVPEALDRRQLSELLPGGLGDRLRDRMLGRRLDGTREPQDLGTGHTAERCHIRELHPAFGDGAGLVEDDRVDSPGLLQDLGPLDQHAHLRAAAGADHQRRRCGQAEGDELLTYAELFDGHRNLFAVPQDSGLLRTELDELLDRLR